MPGIDKNGSDIKHNRLQGKTTVVLPNGGGFSRALLEEKSKSLLFPGAVGPWIQMTSA